MIHVRVPAGIGDISWVYSKLHNLGEQLDIQISADNPRRSIDYVKLLPHVIRAEYTVKNFHQIVENSIPAETSKKDFYRIARNEFVNFSANRFLEQGCRLENFIPELPTNLHYNMLTSKQHQQKAQQIKSLAPYPIGIYTSNYVNIVGWDGWHLEEWKILIKQLNQAIPKATFILIGAPYDKPFVEDLSRIIDKIPHINLAGQTSIGEVIEVIKTFKYFISYPCGLAILANVFNIPLMMFYPEHLVKLINTWADIGTIQNKTYKGCVFPQPQEAGDWILKKYKLQEKI